MNPSVDDARSRGGVVLPCRKLVEVHVIQNVDLEVDATSYCDPSQEALDFQQHYSACQVYCIDDVAACLD